jgi:hypothetical protein
MTRSFPQIWASVLFAAALSLPAAAQTFEEAVRINTAAMIGLCLQVMIDRAPPSTALSGAGLTYRAEDRGVNDFGVHRGTGHYFDAPADTAKIEVDAPDRIAGICQVYTRHMDQNELSQIVSNRLFQTYPGTRVRDQNQWVVERPGALPLIVTTRTIGDNHRYETPGTVQVTMSYPG